MPEQPNLWEAAARAAKARKLVDTILLHTDDPRNMDAQQWHWAAVDAGVREPVSQKTKDLVVELAKGRSPSQPYIPLEIDSPAAGAPTIRHPESAGEPMEIAQPVGVVHSGVVGIQDNVSATLRASLLVVERRRRG